MEVGVKMEVGVLAEMEAVATEVVKEAARVVATVEGETEAARAAVTVEAEMVAARAAVTVGVELRATVARAEARLHWSRC